jgi:hypothetical protein
MLALAVISSPYFPGSILFYLSSATFTFVSSTIFSFKDVDSKNTAEEQKPAFFLELFTPHISSKKMNRSAN